MFITKWQWQTLILRVSLAWVIAKRKINLIKFITPSSIAKIEILITPDSFKRNQKKMYCADSLFTS